MTHTPLPNDLKGKHSRRYLFDECRWEDESMGREHPQFCEHGACVNPGDESFGLTSEDCPKCAMPKQVDAEKVREALFAIAYECHTRGRIFAGGGGPGISRDEIAAIEREVESRLLALVEGES